MATVKLQSGKSIDLVDAKAFRPNGYKTNILYLTICKKWIHQERNKQDTKDLFTEFSKQQADKWLKLNNQL